MRICCFRFNFVLFFFILEIGSDANQQPIFERLRNEMEGGTTEGNENSNSVPSTSASNYVPEEIRKRKRAVYVGSGMYYI